MADPMRIRAVAKDGEVNVKVLMSHEMETGQRKDSAGKPIPAHFIQQRQRDLAGQGGAVGAIGARRYRRTRFSNSASRAGRRARRSR